MSDTVDIGAARVRLIVDAADFDPIVAQGQRAIIGFGQVAQQAYDRTEKGTRRAADALLDYVNSLGRADTTMDRYIRTASRMGVEKPVLDAAIAAWARHNDEVEQAADAQADNEAAIKRSNAAYKELVTTQVQMELQARKVAEAQAAQNFNNIQQARAANAQQSFNSVLGVTTPTVDYDRRQAAEDLWGATLVRENQELEEQEQLSQLIAATRADQAALTSQERFNTLLGVNNSEQQNALQLAQRRSNAMAAFLPMLEEEAKLESENSQLVAKQQAFVQQLENTAATAGKTYYEMLQLRAAELGLGEAYQPLIAKIKSQNEAMGAGTLSAKQYEFALRGLPAQFTDVVVSLQGGQKPLTVLLQQGGQIKDMFGGVGNAAKVVGQQIAKIVTNPFFLLAGAAAVIGTALLEATSRMTDFAVATAKGNLAAGNAKGLSTLAEQLAKLDNIGIGHADEAVQSLAAAGKLTGQNFVIAAEASARWATITGQSADTIIGKFNELANDPMQAVLDGTLKVTEAQYEQLAALERTGQKAKEAQLAVKLYADQINNDSKSVLDNLTEGAKGWIELKDAIAGAWHTFTQFASEAAGTAFQHLKAPTLGDLASAGTGGEGMIDLLNQGDQLGQKLGGAPAAPTPAVTPAVQAAIAQGVMLTTDQVNANKELQKSIDELGTKQQKFDAALKNENGLLSRVSDGYLKQAGIVKSLAGTFSGPGYDKLVNGLRLKIFGENQGGDPTKPIKEWEKTALDSLKAVQEADDNLYKNHLVSVNTFYDISEGLARGDAVIQLESIDKQIKALQGRANSESTIAQLKQQRNTVEAQQIVQLTKLENARADALKAQRTEYENYVDALGKANNALSRQGDQAAGNVGQGSREASLSNAQSNAKYNTATSIQDIQKQIDNGQIDPAEGLKKQDAAAAALSTQLDILQGNYDSLSAAQSSWQNGATKAWQNFSDNVANVAAQTDTLVTSVLNDLTDMFVGLAQNGKLSFTKLIGDITSQIEKAGFQYLIKSLLGGSSGGGSSLGGLSGVAGLIGSSGAGGAAASGVSGLVSLFSGSFGGGFFAQGGVFPGGTGLSSYRNSVVSSPTVFPFAKGGVPNVGVMGEAGSEAIMPLTRTSGGELGVKMHGNTQPQRVNNINQTIIVPGAATRSTQDQTAIKVYGAAQRAARRS